MTKQTILLDCDDTLGDFKSVLQNMYREITGDATICSSNWTTFGEVNRYGIPNNELLDHFIAYKALERITPHDGVSEITHALSDMGFNIEIVTARAWHPEAYEITEGWLTDNNVYFDKINIVPLNDCKETATRHIPNVKIFVDDRYDHCKEMADASRVEQCLMFSQPWNKQVGTTIRTPKIQAITSLYEILDHL